MSSNFWPPETLSFDSGIAASMKMNGPDLVVPNATPRVMASGRPRLVAIDVDQTLIRSDHTLSAATIAAVSEARGAGVEVVLASSRPPRALLDFLVDLDLVEPNAFVGSQGAVVGTYTRAGELSVLASQPIDLDTAHAVVRFAQAEGLDQNWYAGDRWFASALSPEVQREADIVGFLPTVVDVSALNDPPQKLLVIAPDIESASRLGARLPAGVTGQLSNARYLEITASGVDKATGVAEVARTLGIRPIDIVAIGDGRNDLGLFGYPGRAVAPANSHPSVLAAADYLAPSNDDDGVAVTLRWLLSLAD